jgi:hypothetical protein
MKVRANKPYSRNLLVAYLLVAAGLMSGCPTFTEDGFSLAPLAGTTGRGGDTFQGGRSGLAGDAGASGDGGSDSHAGTGAGAEGGAGVAARGGAPANGGATTAGGTLATSGGASTVGGTLAASGGASTAGGTLSVAGGKPNAAGGGPPTGTGATVGQNEDSCENHVVDGSETDIDCGGSCAKCADGKACLSHADCAGGRCSESQTCRSCGLRLISTEAACPSECTSCAGGTCYIECDGNNSCKKAMTKCPKGLACVVACSGEGACEGSQVTCPGEFPCDVECTGKRACKDVSLRCASGPCTLQCNAERTCEGAAATCGSDRCAAECTKGASSPQLSCGSACTCAPCAG